MDIRIEEIILNCIQQHFPLSYTGRKRSDHRTILRSIYYVLHTGRQWRALSCSISYQTVHRHFMKWSQQNIFKQAYEIAYKLQNRQRRTRTRFQCIDSTFVKNIYGRDCIGRNPTDRGRKATKLSALIDQYGFPLSLVFFPANVHDVRTVEPTIHKSVHSLSYERTKTPLYADKGYDSKAVRTFITSKQYIDRISRRGKVTHRLVNRRRNIVERFFSWLDKSRRLLLRYEVNITSYESFTWLACLKRF